MDIIWVAQTSHRSHGTKWLAFRSQTAANAWVKARRAQGLVETYMVQAMCLS